jgi:quercetin dioxygenase-like cupin family protein
LLAGRADLPKETSMPRTRATLLAAVFLGSAALAPVALAQSSGALTTFKPTDAALKWGACPEGLPKGCQVAVLNGDPGKPNADVFLRLPGKSKVPPHKHTSAERIVMMQGTLRVTYEGSKPTTVGKGAYLYGPAGAVHEATCTSAEACVLFIAFEQPVDFVPAPMAAGAGQPAAASAPKAAEKKPK